MKLANGSVCDVRLIQLFIKYGKAFSSLDLQYFSSLDLQYVWLFDNMGKYPFQTQEKGLSPGQSKNKICVYVFDSVLIGENRRSSKGICELHTIF